MMMQLLSILAFTIALIAAVPAAALRRSLCKLYRPSPIQNLCKHNKHNKASDTVKLWQLPASNLRTATISTVAIAFIIATTPPQAVHANIPTMDDYAATSTGTVLRNSDAEAKAAQNRKKLQNLADMDTKTKLLQMPSILKDIEKELKQEQWDQVIAIIKPLKQFKQKNFGYSSASALAKELGLTLSTASELDTLREDFYFSLGQVNDISVSSRVYYFNKDDLKATQQLIDDVKTSNSVQTDTLKEDKISEPLQLLADADAIAKNMIKLLP